MSEKCRAARLRNSGRITNYEMNGLRKEMVWRGVRWAYLWESLSDAQHPRSLEEWRAMKQAQDGDE